MPYHCVLLMMSFYKQRFHFFFYNWVLEFFLLLTPTLKIQQYTVWKVPWRILYGRLQEIQETFSVSPDIWPPWWQRVDLQNLPQSRFISSCPPQCSLRIKPSQFFECPCCPQTDPTPSSSGGQLNLTQSWDDRKILLGWDL